MQAPYGVNRFELSALVLERAALRYTPAGMPALDLVLRHESVVQENGMPRKVSMDIRALCIGEVTQTASAIGVGACCHCSGFLTSGRNGRGLVFHITDIALESSTEA